MFRHGPLLTALSKAAGHVPTDEAQAMEQMGLNPKLILGDSNNFKITYAQDLALATLLLKENE
jgi:2-C-methyl-D-erythritol 4-phosphate cytidylyltransferase